jgi:DNA repair exonuclease SbcCD ATPase subunit
MIIKKLELSNFQVIKEFNADFEGNVYFITGDNELGKSTLLKAIGALLTGNRDAVLRNGEDKGFAKMVVGDDGEEYDVELRFTKANPRGTLSIKQKTTGMRSDNVSMLQKVFGYTDFDAVEFSRWSETAEGRRKQVEYVRALLPENVQKRIAEIDAEVTTVKDKRKEANAEVKTYTTICAAAEKQLKPGDAKTYAEKIDIADLMEEQNENARLIEKAKTVRTALQTRTEQLDAIPERVKQANADHDQAAKRIADDLEFEEKEVARIIAEAQQRLADAKKEAETSKKLIDKELKDTLKQIETDKADYETRKNNAAEWLKKYEENNPEKLDTAERLKQAEEHNKINALVVDYVAKKKQKDAAEKVAQTHEKKLSDLLKERETLIAKSELPIAGLTFTDDGLELNGVPFVAGKVSDSQIMEVAAKLIIASNPTVKVFRIARGESLGAKRLQSLIELARKEGYQGFIEEVKRGQDDLIIEEYSENE